MELQIDSYIQSNNYWYRVKSRLSADCYVASIIYQTDKGWNESFETFLLVTDERGIGSISRRHGDQTVETVTAPSGSPVLVVRDTEATRQLAVDMDVTRQRDTEVTPRPAVDVVRDTPRSVPRQLPTRSFGSKLWSKTWRLLAAAGCFAAAGLCVWVLTEVFSPGGGHRHIRGSVVIGPIFFSFMGLKYLFGFFKHLFVSER